MSEMQTKAKHKKRIKGDGLLIWVVALVLTASIGVTGCGRAQNDDEIAPVETTGAAIAEEQNPEIDVELPAEKESVVSESEGTKEEEELAENEETAQVEQDEKVPLTLSYEDHRALNVFFSNFTEVSLQPFKQGEINANELIRFGFFHHYINIPRRVDYRDYYAYISEDHIYESIQKYFGIDMHQHSFDPHSLQLEYENGYYFFPAADGETPPFAQLSALYDNGDGTYTALVDVYEALALDVFSYEPIASWPAEVTNNTRKNRTMIALITHTGDRYLLLEYMDKE